jgi:malonyl-CoA O-methyltransferase
MALGTARSIGLEERTETWRRWLIARQQADGSLKAAAHSSLWNTSQFVRGASAGGANDAPAAIRAACGYVRACVESAVSLPGLASGLHPAQDDETFGPGGYDPITEFLVALAAWRSTARRNELGDTASASAAEAATERAFSFFQRAAGQSDARIAAEAWAWRIEAFLDLGWHDLADEALRAAAARQRRDGSVDESWGEGRASIAAVAHLAALWYRGGNREPAERAMRFLERRRGPWDSPTLIHYLDAAVARVAVAFDATAGDFPDRIDPRDGRAEAVLGWFAALGASASVADVGCGKGRFLRLLAERFPAGRWTGIDVAPAMLACVPPAVTACCGSLLGIPLADGSFDGAFAVESLEHALLPERAVSELCRIVRPGGRVLVIDKHRARQPLSYHDPWERWFTPEELGQWLRRWCDDVVVRPISHREGRPGRDLFLAAVGTKR